jgi:predicted AAA+ superfamily ATPase
MAIQVCYSLDNSEGTFDREVKTLLKISEVLECRSLLIVTRDDERTLEMKCKLIEIVPAWKWLLNNC